MLYMLNFHPYLEIDRPDDPIFVAINTQNVHELETLLRNGTDPNAATQYQMWTALHYICRQGTMTKIHLKMIQILIRFNADVNRQDAISNSPATSLFTCLHNYKRRMEAFQLLLDSGADVSLSIWGCNTLLHIILNAGQRFPDIFNATKALLERGADANVSNSDGLTPLHCAVESSYSANVVELLLKNGADPNIVCYNNMTVLNFLCNQDIFGKIHLNMFRHLIRHNADMNMKDSRGRSPLWNLCVCRDSRMRRGRASQIFFRIFKLMVENGADVMNANENGEPVMNIILKSYRGASWMDEAIAILLKRARSDDIGVEDRMFVVHKAVRYVRASAVEVLLENSADPNLVDAHGNIALNYAFEKFDTERQLSKAVFEKYLEILRLTAERTVDLTRVGANGKTILHTIIMKLCLKLANIPHNDVNRDEKVHLIATYTPRYIEILLQHGFDVDAPDRNRRTPLNEAVSYFNDDIVEFLLNKGANVDTAEFQGGFLETKLRPLQDLATTLRVVNVIRLLQSNGFRMTPRYFLSVFKFLIIPYRPLTVEDCSNVFQYGSGTMIRNYVESRLAEGVPNRFYRVMNEHLYMIERGNMYMDDETRNYLRDKLRDSGHSTLPIHEIDENRRDEIVELNRRMDQDVQLVENKIVGDNLTLLDLCTLHPDVTYRLLQIIDNNTYVRAVYDRAFRFKTIGGIVKGHITKCHVREFIKNMTYNVVEYLYALPILCCDKIIEYLDVETLVAIYEALMIQ